MTRELLRTDWMNIVSRLSTDEAGERFSEEMMRVLLFIIIYVDIIEQCFMCCPTLLVSALLLYYVSVYVTFSAYVQ